MSKWSSTSEELAREIARGLIVAEYSDDGTTATDYIGRDW
jgi:hypothetical protein